MKNRSQVVKLVSLGITALLVVIALSLATKPELLKTMSNILSDKPEVSSEPLPNLVKVFARIEKQSQSDKPIPTNHSVRIVSNVIGIDCTIQATQAGFTPANGSCEGFFDSDFTLTTTEKGNIAPDERGWECYIGNPANGKIATAPGARSVKVHLTSDEQETINCIWHYKAK